MKLCHAIDFQKKNENLYYRIPVYNGPYCAKYLTGILQISSQLASV